MNRIALEITRIFKPYQVRKAAELIRDRAIAHYAGDTYRVTSVKTDAKTGESVTSVYYTNVRECSCKAGQGGVRCYHRAAVYMIDMAHLQSLARMAA
jgi:hypothetical protein